MKKIEFKYEGYAVYTDGYAYRIIRIADDKLIEKGVVSWLGTVLIPKEIHIAKGEEKLVSAASKELISRLREHKEMKLEAYREKIKALSELREAE